MGLPGPSWRGPGGVLEGSWRGPGGVFLEGSGAGQGRVLFWVGRRIAFFQQAYHVRNIYVWCGVLEAGSSFTGLTRTIYI